MLSLKTLFECLECCQKKELENDGTNMINAPLQTPSQNRRCALSDASTVSPSWDNRLHPTATSVILEYKWKDSMWLWFDLAGAIDPTNGC